MINRMELMAPCHFGLEAVLKREIDDLGYDIVKVEDGRVTFFGDEESPRGEIEIAGHIYDYTYVHELQRALRCCGLWELAENFKVI